MDKLIENGDLSPQVALAVAEALDITIKAANLATVPMLDARFAQQDAKMEARFAQQVALFAQLEARSAQQDAKMEARFGSIEKLIESTKVWATLLYAGLAAVVFGALSVDHRWLVNREDQLMAQIQARNDARFAKEEATSTDSSPQTTPTPTDSSRKSTPEATDSSPKTAPIPTNSSRNSKHTPIRPRRE